MEYINNITIFFKRKFNKNKNIFHVAMIFIILLGLIFSSLIDRHWEHGTIMNICRSLIVAITSFFIVVYYVTLYNETLRKKRLEIPEYVGFRERLSQKQRSNLALIVVGTLIVLHITLIPVKSSIYSFFSTFVLAVIMYIPVFLQKTGYEKYLEQHNYKDVRDYNEELKEFDKRMAEKDLENTKD